MLEAEDLAELESHFVAGGPPLARSSMPGLISESEYLERTKGMDVVFSLTRC